MAKNEPCRIRSRSPARGRQGHLADAQGNDDHPGMVFVMVIVASLFFLLVDQALALGVRTILGLGV